MANLKTGDVILFAENSSIFDLVLRTSTGKKWTHVAIVFENPPDMPLGTYILEAGREREQDQISGKKIYGVQLQFLSKVRDSQTYVRRLVRPLDPEQTSLLWSLAKSLDGRPYDLQVSDWIGAIKRFEGLEAWEQQTTCFWCSALVAYLYVKVGLLQSDLPWTLVAPHEWAEEGASRLRIQQNGLSEVESLDHKV